MQHEQEQELEKLESAMWRAETRCDRRWMEAHLAESFIEFGQSGRRYTRDEILDLGVGDLVSSLPLGAFRVDELGEDHALVTYQSEGAGARANRSSIWKRTTAGWLLVFHQGTATTTTR